MPIPREQDNVLSSECVPGCKKNKKREKKIKP